MKRFLLDENLLICGGERNSAFYHQAGHSAKNQIEDECERVIGTKCKVYYVGQDEALPFNELPLEAPHRYNNDLKYSEYSSMAMRCGLKIGNDFQFAGMRGNRPVEPGKDRRDLDRWKTCVTELVNKEIPTRDVIGTAQMPPQSAADVQIRDWAERNAVIVVSADADSWLEGRGDSDRLLIEHPKCSDSHQEYAQRLSHAVLSKMKSIWG
jgi:hypothetical protein